jgi:predicted O-methyltransferase YrrM
MPALPVIEFDALKGHFDYKNTDGITIKTDFSDGISPVNDYYFLSWIAKAVKAKKYFEIGTWKGLSAYNIISNNDNQLEIFSLDIPFDHPEIKIFNIPEEIFGYYSKENKSIHHIKCDSKSFDYKPYAKQFEFVFVDGNHSFEYVQNDTKLALELLKDENSVIAWHDYLILGEVNKNVLAGILETIPEEEHKHIVSLHQSNLALYSKSFKFLNKKLPEWYLPKQSFELILKVKNK